MANKADIRRFLREIRKSIPGGGKQKKQMIERVKASILEYLAEKPDAGYDDLCARFGAPEQIAASYLEELDVSDLKKQLTIREKIVCAVVAVVIVAVGIWAGVVVHALREYGDAMPGYIEVTVEVEERVPGE